MMILGDLNSEPVDPNALEESSTSYFGGTTVAPREEQQL